MAGTGAPVLACWAALAALAAAPRVAAGETPAGDARSGEALFLGSARFEKGGAPCLACHGVAGHGLARAASFGPDLSDVHARYGVEALDGTFADMPFPSMQPIYAARPLSAVERANLIAFLGTTRGEAPRLGAPFLLGATAIGALFLLAVLALGRLRGSARGPTQRSTP